MLCRLPKKVNDEDRCSLYTFQNNNEGITLNFLGDLFNSLKTTLSERTKSYYIGSFIFSWVTFNWRIPLILLFSSKDIESKINYISDTININNTLWYPAVMSLVLSILLPCINMIVSLLQKWPNRLVRNITTSQKQEQYQDDIVTEALRAQKDMAYQKKTVSESLEVQNLQAQIQESKNISEKLQNEIDRLTGELENKELESGSLLEKIEEIETEAMFKDSKIESLTKDLGKANNSLTDSNERLTDILKENKSYEGRITRWKEELNKYREERSHLYKEIPVLFSVSNETKTYELNLKAISAIRIGMEYLQKNRPLGTESKITPSQNKLLREVLWGWDEIKDNAHQVSNSTSIPLTIHEHNLSKHEDPNFTEINKDS